MRIGIIREFMVKHAKVDEPIVDAAAAEMKAMLGGHLGATLVESVTPGWVDDPDIENMTTTFDRAIAELVPVLYPDLLFRLNAANEPLLSGVCGQGAADRVRAGRDQGHGIDGGGRLDGPLGGRARADAAESDPAHRARRRRAQSRTFRFHIPQYLMRRAKDWDDRGFKETLVDWPSLNARSKFWGDDQRAAFKNWEEIDNLHEPPKGIADNIQRREFLRRVLMKVILDNKLDLLIQVHTALPPGKIGLAPEPNLNNRAISYPLGPNAGITEILIPAGYVKVAYDPVFELATDANGRKFYRSRTGTTPTEAPAPGIPFSINFLVEPGMEHLALKAASAYQSASKRRVPPPAFPPFRASRSAGSVARVLLVWRRSSRRRRERVVIERLVAELVALLVEPPERLLEERRLRIPCGNGSLDDVQLLIVHVDRRHRARSVAVRQMHLMTADAVRGIPRQLRHLRIALHELPRRMEERALIVEPPVSHTRKTGASIAPFGARRARLRLRRQDLSIWL